MLASACSAYLCTRRLRLPPGRALRFLAGLVPWEAIQIVPVQLLAAMQIAGLVPQLTMRLLATSQIVSLAGACGWFWSRKTSSASAAQSESPAPRLPTYIFVSILVLASSYCLFALDVFTSFPSGSDALIYHLPLALRWLQDGSLNLPASRVWPFSLAGNAEIVMMILLSSGIQAAVVLVNWIAATMLALSAYLLAMWMSKGNKVASVTVCLIVMSVPMVEFQTFSAYVDLFGTAAICAAFALALSGSSAQGKKAPSFLEAPLSLIAALACGISLGTKPIFYFYAFVWAAFLFFVLWQKRSPGTRAFLRPALLACIGLLLPSGFWFARAAIQTGNPVYPIQVRVGQQVIFRGVDPSQIAGANFGENTVGTKFEENFVHAPREWLIYPWTEWKRYSGYLMIPYSEGSGTGAVFATFVPVAVLVFFYFTLTRSRTQADWIALSLFVLLGLAWWLVMQRVPRYGLPIIVFACVLSVSAIGALHARSRRAFGILLVSSLIATCGVSSFVPFHTLAGRIRVREWSRAQIYGYPKLIDDLPPGSRVLNATELQEKNFPLAGKALTNRVIAGFEAPSDLTPESLRATAADFVVETVPGGKYQPASLVNAGAKVVADTTVLAGEDRVHWRIWQVEKQAAEKKSVAR